MVVGFGKIFGRETYVLVYKICNLKWKIFLREDVKMVIFLFKDEFFIICSL